MNYHVITPLTRYGNLGRLWAALMHQSIQWHVIVDDPFPLSVDSLLDGVKIKVRSFAYHEGSDRCLEAINWWLDNNDLVGDDRYCFLNDDDSFDPGFFSSLRAVDDEVVIVSMKRGDKIPEFTPPNRAHGTNTLIAAPDNMKPCQVSLEQLIVSGRILKGVRFPIFDCGDGRLIEKITSENPVKYLPDVFVHFNYYEPGRWNLL